MEDLTCARVSTDNDRAHELPNNFRPQELPGNNTQGGYYQQPQQQGYQYPRRPAGGPTGAGAYYPPRY